MLSHVNEWQVPGSALRAASGGDAGASKPADDNVVDAEVKEVKKG